MSSCKSKIKLSPEYKRIIKLHKQSFNYGHYESERAIKYEQDGKIKEEYIRMNSKGHTLLGSGYDLIEIMNLIYSMKFYDDYIVFCLVSNRQRMFKINRTKYKSLKDILREQANLIKYLNKCNIVCTVFDQNNNVENFMEIVNSLMLHVVYDTATRYIESSVKDIYTSVDYKISNYKEYKVVRKSLSIMVNLIEKHS